MVVIEADAKLATGLVRALEQKGHSVDHCAEAIPGFRKACEVVPDCIVVAPELPDIDGVWVARKVRTEPGPIARVPILFVGTLSDDGIRAQALGVGADAFLARPVADAEIVAQVGALVAMARRYDRGEEMPVSLSAAAALRGDLAAFPIASVLMMFELERRSGLVEVVSSTGTRARLTVSTGLFASTEINGAQRPALQVLREVIAWRAGRFSFQPRESETLPAPRASIGALVLEAVRIEDEANNPVPELDPDDLVEADSRHGDRWSKF